MYHTSLICYMEPICNVHEYNLSLPDVAQMFWKQIIKCAINA